MEKAKPAFPNWISTGNVLTIVAMVVTALWTVAQINAAQAVQAERSVQAKNEIERVDRDQKQLREEIKGELRDLRADVKELLRRNGR